MDYAYRFGDPRRIYLNVTNRCTNRCCFCVRYACEGLGGAQLWADEGDGSGAGSLDSRSANSNVAATGNRGGTVAGEPDLGALCAAVRELGGPAGQDEIIWCGFGEPTFRMNLIEGAADFLRSGGARVRLDTNGHAALIAGRPVDDVAARLAVAVDAVSVSLNAPTEARYLELCQPTGEDILGGNALTELTWRRQDPGGYWEAVQEFIRAMSRTRVEVTASVVGAVLDPDEVEASRVLAAELGADHFRIR